MFNTAGCLAEGLGLGLVSDLVSGYAPAFILGLLSVDTVP